MSKLALIFFISLAVRLVGLTTVPPSLNWDEVSHAYTAYSLLHTGHDQWGQTLPIINFRAFGDYPTALDLYFTVPFIAVLGPTDLAARLPHALAGSITVILIYIAGYRLFRSPKLASIVSLICIVDPWLFFTSRQVLQSNIAVLFLCLLLVSYPRRLWLGVLGLLAYHNTRIFLPLLFVGLSVFTRKHYLYTVLIVSVAALILLMPTSRARSQYVSLISPGTVSFIEQQRATSHLSPPWPQLLYNRPVYLATHTLLNYVDYFSPRFLFLSGGTQYQFSLPGFGVLNPALFIFFYIGLGVLLIQPVPNKHLLLLWLVLAPLPAAVTQDRFAVVRATTMLPIPQIISGLGLVWFMRYKLFKLLFLGLFTAFTSIYLYNYFFTYPQAYSQSWQYGYREVAEYINNHADITDQILITKRYGEPHEYVLWYFEKLDANMVWDFHDNWYWVDKVGNFTFYNDWQIPSDRSKYRYVVSSPDNPVYNGKLVRTVKFLDGQPAFLITQQY